MTAVNPVLINILIKCQREIFTLTEVKYHEMWLYTVFINLLKISSSRDEYENLY